MVLLGDIFAARLFNLLGFGPSSRHLDAAGIDYSLFAFGVLDAVIIGWMTALWGLMQFCGMDENPYHVRHKARKAILASSVIWFVWDTGFSIWLDEYEHALFNVPFLTVLVVPIHIMNQNDRPKTP